MKLNWAKRMSLVDNPSLDVILSVIGKPGLISMAGGLPSQDAFPVVEMEKAFTAALEDAKGNALQYGATEGFMPLREWIAGYMNEQGISCSAQNIMVTSGSQQGIELIARSLVEPGDTVIVESPSYMAALQVFVNQEARIVAVPSDGEGIIIEGLKEILVKEKPKFIYVIPTFQNPSGLTLGKKRREELLSIANELEIPLVEDNPYGELRYKGEPQPTIKSLPGAEGVIYLGTFSKIVAPGLRLGWMVTSPEVIRKFAALKQSSDLLSNQTSQMALVKFLETGILPAHIEKVKALYTVKRDAMEAALVKYFPEGVTWTDAEGGMFVWATLPEGIDTMEMFQDALEAKVAYVPGVAFYPDGRGKSSMRLNFSGPSPEELEEGIKRLGDVIRKKMGK